MSNIPPRTGKAGFSTPNPPFAKSDSELNMVSLTSFFLRASLIQVNENSLKIKVLRRRPPTFWERFYLPQVALGLLTTITHLVKHLFGIQKIATYEYPDQPKPIPADYRSEHRLMKRPDGAVRCTACMLCATACPAECIEIVAAENPDPKIEKYPSVYNINLLRCVFCGFCVEACPCDAIRMDTKKVDMAGYTREEYILDINYLLNNHPEGMSPTSIAP